MVFGEKEIVTAQKFSDLPPLTLQFLDYLEVQVLDCLTWGSLDTSLDEDGVLVCAQDFLRNYGSKESLGTTPLPTANELFQALKETQLLFEFELGDCEKRYRTRMAETLRLIVRLKQLFKEEGWEHRPDLVSDYRLMVRPRAFPKRTIAPTSIQSDQLTAIQNALLAYLTAQNGTWRAFNSNRRSVSWQKQNAIQAPLSVRAPAAEKPWRFTCLLISKRSTALRKPNQTHKKFA